MLTEEHIRRGLTPDAARRAAAVQFGGADADQGRAPRRAAACRSSTRRCRICATGCARCARTRRIRWWRSRRWRSASAPAPPSSASPARCCCGRCPTAIPDGWSASSRPTRCKNWTRNIASPANYADWKSQNTVFTDIAAYEQFNETGSGASEIFLTGQGEPQGLKSLGVTGNLFTVLGARPLLGRPFTDEETFEGKARVVILSHGLWQSAFAGDPAIIGRSITLSGRAYDVVGVMPRDFFFPGRDVHLWLPVAYQPSVFVRSRRPHWLGVVARLSRASRSNARSEEMDQIARGLEQQYPDTNTQMGVRLERFHDSLAYAPRPALLMLSGAVGAAVPHRLREPREPAARARDRPDARAGDPARARRRAPPPGPPAVDRIADRLRDRRRARLRLAVARAGRRCSGSPRRWCRCSPRSVSTRSVVLFSIGLSLLAPVIFGVLPALMASSQDGWPSAAKSRRATRVSCAARSSPPRSRCRSCSSSAPSCWRAACCGCRRSTRDSTGTTS